MNVRIRAILTIALLMALGGCSGDAGPPMFRVTGAVTFDGQPIPRGMVVFSPDLAKKNDGPQGVASITDGKYDTGVAQGQGFVGGPVKVSVTGLAADETPLCQYEFELDLPREDSTKDIEVPKSAALNAAPFEGP